VIVSIFIKALHCAGSIIMWAHPHFQGEYHFALFWCGKKCGKQ